MRIYVKGESVETFILRNLHGHIYDSLHFYMGGEKTGKADRGFYAFGIFGSLCDKPYWNGIAIIIST